MENAVWGLLFLSRTKATEASSYFTSHLEALPNILQKKYSLLRDLDKSLQEIQRQNEQRCDQEIEDIKQGVKAGNITPNTSLIRFSDEGLDEQKHSIRIADEKIALAVQAYDLDDELATSKVDAHIQQLDQFLKLCDEDNRRERDSGAAAPALPASSFDGSTKSGRGSESGRGGRKKDAGTSFCHDEEGKDTGNVSLMSTK
ncbi:unnamed protein product [Dovyalis caffra]|uniref:Inhibitor of growth protein N-terminal histone-binding domain-containing protein n=1 Tax=Dovyalis caffra TaxID=77055 RepID=A0AAV1RLU9_9ROSI|nr:unnamed protein product [Dovyalis caffra]